MLLSFLKKNRLVATVALIAIVVFTCIAYFYFSTVQLGQKQSMIPYTQSMKTVCVGRYLLDIPASSVELRYGQEIDGIPITKLSGSVRSATDYEKIIKIERAEIDKKILDAKEMGGTFISEVKDLPRIAIYFYSLNEHQSKADLDLYHGKDTLKHMAGFIWSGERIYKFQTKFDKKNLESIQSKLIALMNNLQPWDGITPPKTPGVCIDEAFIASGPFERGEYVSFGADIDKNQNTRISFTTRGGSKFAADGVLKPMPGTTLIERSRNVDDWIKDKKGVDYKSLRRSKRAVLDQPGEEIITRIEEKGKVELQGKIEVIGGGEPKKQYYSFAINSKNTITDPQSGAKITIEDPIQNDVAIAVWDKFVGSLRLRSAAF